MQYLENYHKYIDDFISDINLKNPDYKIAIGERVWFHPEDIVMPEYKGSFLEINSLRAMVTEPV